MISIVNSEELSVLLDERVVSKTDVPHIGTLFEAAEKLTGIANSKKSELEAAAKKGYAEGFEAGRACGHEQGRDDLSKHMLMLSKAFAQEKQMLQKDVIQLSMQVIRKIATTLGPEKMIASLAETAIDGLLDAGNGVVLYVHPTLLDSRKVSFSRVRKACSDAGLLLEIKEDDSLEPFDCTLETMFGTTMAGLDAQLNCLQVALNSNIDSPEFV